MRPRFIRWSAVPMLLCLFMGTAALAAPPSFTGQPVQAQGGSALVNLRAQGALAGTAPMNVEVNAVRVGGLLSPVISILRAVLQPGASTSVCVQVQNLLGLDLTALGVEMDITAFNAEAPSGISGRIAVRSGSRGEDISPQACSDAVALAPSANAGPDQNLADTDQQPGEQVTLDGSGSVDPDGAVAAYQWLNAANQVVATGVQPAVRLPDGLQTLTLVVTDESGLSATDTVNIRITAPAANQLPVANAGGDRVVADTDGQAGETVALDASQSSDADGTLVLYEWLVGQSTVLATGVTASARLPDGASEVTLRVTDNDGGVATDTVSITVGQSDPGGAPTANAGPDRTVADSDGAMGETVTLDGTASTGGAGAIASYTWLLAGQQIAIGVTATARLPDGESFVTLVVTDVAGASASDGVLVNVLGSAPIAPVANAGADRSIDDSDAAPGELVTLDGSGSNDADGVIVNYQWTLAGQPLATGATATVRLPDGDNIVTLTVTDDDGNSSFDAAQISVLAPGVSALANIPGLTPNQRSVAVAMDSLCPRLRGRAATETLTEGATDLLARCNGITFGSSVTEQVRALDEISPQDLNATRTQTLNLSRAQLANVGDRLIALRAGARGLSLTGLNLQIDGQSVPLQQLAALGEMLGADMLGGGASADEQPAGSDSGEPGGLLENRLSLWLRGSYSFGEKAATIAGGGFDADQWGVVGGADFRFSRGSVAGLAVGYGRSDVAFNPAGAGTLDTQAITAALYATAYAEQGFYVDAMASYLQSGYDSQRRIVFTEGGRPVDVTASGATDGATVGVALTFGYDLTFGGFTIAPSLGYNYLVSRIDRFRENGASGLDLAYEEQDHNSATANAGLRLTYAWRTAIGVVVPQIRGEFIREFIEDTEAFGVRFANDPFDDTPRIVVSTEIPDRSYWRVAAGFSAQFRYGIAGFIEYQRLESLRYFDYADIALGLRIETAFE